MKNEKNKKRVAIGLSGGVDSAVAAYLLKKQGYEVTGVYINCWKEPGCRSEGDRLDAVKTAFELGISFESLDFRKEYREKVFEYFLQEYGEGRTPNPDVLCNSVIKFGLFYEWAIKEGYDFVATGHYARIGEVDPSLSDLSHQIRHTRDDKFDLKSLSNLSSKKNKYGLWIGRDLKKDQSYFLYKLKQEQLGHIIFPVGDLLKAEVRKIAKKVKLSVADKKDSMGICFVGDINVREFLLDKYGVKKGKVVLADGTIIGEHDGYFLFNIGHRGGWKRKSKIQNAKFRNNDLPKLYVSQIKKEQNEIVVGEKEDCLRDEFCLCEIYKIDGQDFENEFEGYIKIRNTGDFLEAKFEKKEDRIEVKLKEKVFGVSKGQSGVIYQEARIKGQEEQGFEVLGGGIIE